MRIWLKKSITGLLVLFFFLFIIIPFKSIPASGEDLLKTRLFAIQRLSSPEGITWGREGYPMTSTQGGSETTPLFLCSFYLSLIPYGTQSQASDLYYFVLDSEGNIWVDPDGKFNNCLYEPTRDPENMLFQSGSCKESNRIEGRTRYSIDPKPDNNTGGPYSLEKILGGNQVIVQIKGKKYILGILDRTDFVENSMVYGQDWDTLLPLINFLPTEKHAENILGNGEYDSFEWIYQQTISHTEVSVGDKRLSPVIVPGSTDIYEPNSIVRAGDQDIGFPLVSFQGNEKHYKSDPLVDEYRVTRRYGFDFYSDFIYQDIDEDNFVSPGETRLSPVNVCIDGSTGNLKNFGLTLEDGLLFVEIPETNERINYAFETNYPIQSPQTKVAVKVFSVSTSVPLNITSLSRSISMGLNKTQNLSFIQDIQPSQSGYLGFEWFLDNGINNKMFQQSLQKTVASNLSDDFTDTGESEEIWGQYSRTGDLDYRSTLSGLPGNIRYYNSNSSGFGAFVPFYRDNDNSYTISMGDERLIDVEINSGSTTSFYPIGSLVSLNDADSGFVLQDIPVNFRFLDKNLLNPEFSNNGNYEIHEAVYKKNALSLEGGHVEVGDLRITPVSFGIHNYEQGTFVAPSVFYFHESKIWGLFQGLSGDFRLLDVPVTKGKASIKLISKQTLKVELTSLFEFQINPLKQGEKLILLVDGPTKRSDTKKDLMIVKNITGPFHDNISLTITPYVSSYSEKGPMYPLTFLFFVDYGGSPIKIPDFFDEVLDANFLESIYDHHVQKYESWLPGSFFPDTVNLIEQFVIPEDLTVLTSKNSISQYDLRFPNLWAKLQDVDNPDDVNDPSQIISSQAGTTFVANYNVSGAGISYLCTTYGYLSDQPDVLQYFIVQVNNNQTYSIWQWKDEEPKGVLNWGDRLSNVPITISENPVWGNNDCSIRYKIDSWDILGTNWLTRNDSLGIFDGQNHELVIDDISLTLSGGRVQGFGVQAKLEPFGSLSKTDVGGDFPLVVLPRFSDQDMTLLIYSTSFMFDYKNSIQHPPYFIPSDIESINFRGSCKLKAPRIEDVNVTNLTIVDHSLSYSKLNYTYGDNALSPLKDIHISAPYNPIIQSMEQDLIVYPGGNFLANRYFPEPLSGYTGYPTINKQRIESTGYRKMGTEEDPLTDYSFYFMIQTKSGEFVRFDQNAPPWFRIEKIVVEGPFKTPKMIREDDGTTLPELGYPVIYDYSGKLIIDRENEKWYQSKGADWTGRIGLGKNEYFADWGKRNSLLERTQILNYKGFPYVFKIPEITPQQAGRLHITIYLGDGTITEIGDCCSSEPKTGIMAHGLQIGNLPTSLIPGISTQLKPIIRVWEENKKLLTDYCNNAYAVLWQDRGALGETGEQEKYYSMGAGDGRLQGYRTKIYDHNLDGKISFTDYETEIMGAYDLATNTWSGGVIDARTFNTENGVYSMTLSLATGSQTNAYGADFNSDHLIDEDEECPIYFSAYQYYDDNNDRAFTPLYKDRSHEVYLAGESVIHLSPSEDLVVESPETLTAGCTPELYAPYEPLTLNVFDKEGKAIDLSAGIADAKGEFLVKPLDIHTLLFNDKPYEPLPQYYWIRTDLHNLDKGFDCNDKMYGKRGSEFAPIRIDFSGKSEGKYQFFGFCANDEGVFEVRVYSPNRLHMGKGWIIVEPPIVQYSISTEGSPLFGADFIMTAGINRIYKVEVEAFSAQSQRLTNGRLTPFTTKPASFDLPLSFSSVPNPYFLHLTLEPNQITSLRGFGVNKNIYYNTTNMQYENGLFSKLATIDPNPGLTLNTGWGFGCIYNFPRDGVYMLADLDGDGRLSSQDSLEIKPTLKTSFSIFAEDVCNLGVLVGANDLSSSNIYSDVSGKPPSYSDSPLTLRGRYRGAWDPVTGFTTADQTFALDWDAFPDNVITCSYPKATLFHSSNGNKLSMDLLSPENYDLAYGITNNLTIHLEPADHRDTPITEGFIGLQGNKSESYIYGSVRREGGYSQTSISFTPTGIGESVAKLFYNVGNKFFTLEKPILEEPPLYFTDLHRLLDCAKALQISFPLGDKLIDDCENHQIIKVNERGSGAVVPDAEVTLSFPGYSQSKVSNSEGVVEFTLKPKKGDKIKVNGKRVNYLPDEVILR